MRRAKLLAIALTAATAFSVLGVSSADISAPGQCKKHQYNCNGNSECAPPHVVTFPNGQQKKC